MLYQKQGTEFIFPGERHDFWEAIIMDKGFAYLLVEDKGYKVEQGEILFFNRNQNHIVWSDSSIPPHFITISFDMEFHDDAFFEFRKFKITSNVRRIIKKILDTRLQLFEGELVTGITKFKDDAHVALAQLLANYIEELMLTLYILGDSISRSAYVPLLKEKLDDRIFKSCIEYLDMNIHKKITLEKLSKSVFASKSYIEKLFREKAGKAFLEYLLSYRLEKAYKMLSQGNVKVTDVASAMGFSSIHYFSRAFSKAYGYPPSTILKS